MQKTKSDSMIALNKNKPKLIVQKYGGATLATPEQIKQAALRIHTLHKTGTQVVVVVSAMGQTTNQLIQLARDVSPYPHLRELDMLLTVGERISMSLLSMALNDLGSNAISFTGSQAGILTDEAHVNATIIDVKAFRVEEALKENKIVILAGFQGVSPQTKEITTLGRGGSDTSAVAMAAYLKADRCEILKDVSAIYSADPKIVPHAKPILNLKYCHLSEMTKWGAKVLHYKSVEMAQLKKVPLYVASAAHEMTPGTLITDSEESSNQNVIAVNSYSTVFKFKKNKVTESSSADLFSFLNRHQIATPEILQSDESYFYVAGPKENLDLIEKIDFKQTAFELIKKTLCSVSVTCQEKPTQILKDLAEKKMQSVQIKFEKIILSAQNINFILDQQNMDQAILALHMLVD